MRESGAETEMKMRDKSKQERERAGEQRGKEG